LVIITSATFGVGCINPRFSVCLSVSVQDNSEIYGWIFIKLGNRYTGPEKRRLSFGSDSEHIPCHWTSNANRNKLVDS